MGVMTTTIETKRCSDCKIDLPIGEFGRDQSRGDGLQGRCNTCRKIYYVDNREQEAQRHKKYFATEKGQEAKHRASRKYLATLKGHLGSIFHSMNGRCTNPKARSYRDYGGRGIQNKFTLDEFRNYVVNDLGITTFEQIQGLQIDRINNDGHYEKGNIRFVTPKENSNNQRPRRKRKSP